MIMIYAGDKGQFWQVTCSGFPILLHHAQRHIKPWYEFMKPLSNVVSPFVALHMGKSITLRQRQVNWLCRTRQT